MISSILLLVAASIYAADAQSCGRPTYQGGRIIGGNNAILGEWPWQVLLTINGIPSCGGSIIDKDWIVTAAHCVINSKTGRQIPAYELTVAYGTIDSWRYWNKKKVFSVTVHTGYDSSRMINDIALIKVTDAIGFNNYVKPICLPSSPVGAGTLCYITGWGRTDRRAQGMSRYLQKASMPVVDSGKCYTAMRRISPFHVGAHSLCSGHGDTRVSGCQGDSGGPFVCNINGVWELHGAVSWGSQHCSERYNTYTVYANIYNLRRWIKSISGV